MKSKPIATPIPSKSARDSWLFLALGLGASFFALYGASFADLKWSQHLSSFAHLPWVQWMDQSFFEGDSLGASDLPMILYGIAFFGYLATFGPRGPRSETKRLRVLLGRVLLTGLLVSLGTHALKWGMDRPRPKDVLGGACPYQEWFEPGRLCIGKHQGKSFPSGHTAAAASLWAMNAAWMAWALGKMKYRKLLGLMLSLLVLFFALAMGISRVMHGDHWLTDTLASILLAGWVVVVFWRKESSWFSD